MPSIMQLRILNQLWKLGNEIQNSTEKFIYNFRRVLEHFFPNALVVFFLIIFLLLFFFLSLPFHLKVEVPSYQWEKKLSISGGFKPHLTMQKLDSHDEKLFVLIFGLILIITNDDVISSL